MMFAVMMKQDAAGARTGHRAEPFDYSGTEVVSVSRFKERFDAELLRVVDFDGGGWNAVCKAKPSPRLPGGRYELRYGADWRDHVISACRHSTAKPYLKGMTCVTELMDHLVAQFNLVLFADTVYHDSWILFHDALTIWWEEEAQAHLLNTHNIGPERQMCFQGASNDLIAKRFVGKLTGNDPRMNPCDESLFSDLERDIHRAVAHTSFMPGKSITDPENHPEKYHLTGRRHS